ncbi:hypothetical protein SteCoe_14970 [Stentor coeruleus]|uniref:Uncharacterized protein n=1 Tax=Stentor coeruleus TaxID=5963 RepID=A0A1R2C4X6_9CILI|nr:hypothetical protein SteCoe_14970 [Stentor coeruleus]
MSSDILVKVLSLEQELTNSQTQILFLQNKNLDLTKSNELLQCEIHQKQSEITRLNSDLSIKENYCNELSTKLVDSNNKLLKVSSELYELNQKLYSINNSSNSIGRIDNSELNLIRMLCADLEARFWRKEQEMITLEQKFRQELELVMEKKTQTLLEKRQNWLNPAVQKIEKPLVSEEDVNWYKESYKRAVIDYNRLYEKMTPEKEKKREENSDLFEDVEKLLGWKVEYRGNNICLSSMGKNVIIRKQVYESTTFYNIEITPETMHIISTQPYSDYLLKYQNYPAFFAAVLSSEFSKLGISN